MTGIRRCGKSSLLDLYHEHLLQEGVLPENIIHMNLEPLRYSELKPLQSINDNYEKIILSMDRSFIQSYEGIRSINLIDWLIA
ncbi:MAG: AAA family ATPase [Oxalobacter sp.]|nr:AAA family ATPase [Oxalobacter sp.]